MTVSEFSRSRPVTEPSNRPRFLTAARSLITKARLLLGKLLSLGFARILMIFLVGFAAGIAWQSYGGGIRKAMAGWSPHLAWIAPAPESSSASAERLKATSLALAGVRQSVDKLATEFDRLQTQGVADQRPASRRASQRH